MLELLIVIISAFGSLVLFLLGYAINLLVTINKKVTSQDIEITLLQERQNVIRIDLNKLL